MHYRRIVALRDDLHQDPTFEHSIGAVQNHVDRMGGISILLDFIPPLGSWANLTPILRNRTAPKALQLNAWNLISQTEKASDALEDRREIQHNQGSAEISSESSSQLTPRLFPVGIVPARA
jgi:hypothetical protein